MPSSRRRPWLVGGVSCAVLYALFTLSLQASGFAAVTSQAVATGMLALGAVVTLTVVRPVWNWRRVPKTALAFGLVVLLSLTWSTTRGTATVDIALTLGALLVSATIGLTARWDELLSAFAIAGRIALVVSVAGIALIAYVLESPLWWIAESGAPEGPPVTIAALITAIATAVRWADGATGRNAGVCWIVLSVLVIAATGPLAGTGAVLLALGTILWARRVGETGRRRLYATTAVIGLGAVVAALLWPAWPTTVLGYAAPPTFATPRNPLIGTGWLDAHPATSPGGWAAVPEQLGFVGTILVLGLVVASVWRGWFLATDRPRIGARTAPYTWNAAAPILLTLGIGVTSLAPTTGFPAGALLLLLSIAWVTKRVRFAGIPLASASDMRGEDMARAE